LVLALGVGLPAVAAADVGTGVGANPITLPSPAEPGHTYTMPPLYVVNTGTEQSTYHVRVQLLGQAPANTVPDNWLQLGKNDFTLGPKESTTVPVELVVPGSAKPGEYDTNLMVGTVAANTPAGATALGAAAAAKVTFTVAKSGPHIPWPWPWWAYTALGVVIAGGAGFLALKRAGFSLQVERRN